jgi:hypothetical protein
MEQFQINDSLVIPEKEVINNQSEFIKANTKHVSLQHLREDCTIPVFSKDNECTISHHQFIETLHDCVSTVFEGQRILKPEIRTSHIIKGRVPEAIGKPVKELTERDKTIYYERMMFKIDLPSITDNIAGNDLNLVVGGVRAYNQENLYSRKTYEKFKLFIGFKNRVCTNLCVSTDGTVEELKAVSLDELREKTMEIIGAYEMQSHLESLKRLSGFSLTEQQFAQFVGRCRMYGFLPKDERKHLAPLLLNDSQINTIVKGYYEDLNFSRSEDGSISMWNLFNLFTGSNKSSYIDSFLSRSLNSHELIQNLTQSIHSGSQNWYLH